MAAWIHHLYFSEYSPKTKLQGPGFRQTLLVIGNIRPAGATKGPCMRATAAPSAARKHLPLETKEQQLVATFTHQSPTSQGEISLPTPGQHPWLQTTREVWFWFFLPGRLCLTSPSFRASGRAQLCTTCSSWASLLATFRPAKQAFVHDKQTGNCLISSVCSPSLLCARSFPI